jgi:HK97 family phage prohead protease
MSQIERRFIAHPTRSTVSATVRTIQGHASTFDQQAEIGGQFLEIVRPGAFKRSLKENRDVLLLFNHDANRLLARTANGSLKLREDSVGLAFSAALPDTTLAGDVLELVKRQTLAGCSFSFIAKRESWGEIKDETGKARPLRELLDVDLFDCSVVTTPAYSATDVSASESASAKDEDDDDAPPLDSLDWFRSAPLHAMFPGGVPQSLPLEVRSGLTRAIDAATNSMYERVLKTRALVYLSKDDLA